MTQKNLRKQTLSLSSVFANKAVVNFVIGLAVVLVLIAGVVFINKHTPKNSGQNVTTNQTASKQDSNKHIVKQGEDLWTIAELHYHDGYKWVQIAKANNIQNPGQITTGQELVIPKLEKIADAADNQTTPTVSPTKEVAKSTTVTQTPMPSPTLSPVVTQAPVVSGTNDSQKIQGNSYTVAHGDDLWDIAQRAYGDGYRWKDIAKANNLENPSIIHSGNVLTIPR